METLNRNELFRGRMQRNISGILLLFMLTIVCAAQSFRGAIRGTVTDPSGAVVSSANLEATDEATGLKYPTTSSSAGQFIFTNLPLGSYTLIVSAPGFQLLTIDGIQVTAGQTYDLRANLTVGRTSTTVAVSAAALAVDSSSTALDGHIFHGLLQSVQLHDL